MKRRVKSWASMVQRWRMVPTLAMASAIILLMAGVGVAVFSERLYENQKAREVAVQGEILANSVAAALASATGYCIGIVAHWLLSSRTVFNDGLAGRGPERTRQKAMFVISALIGLALTTAIVGAADLAGIDPRIAKAFAIVCSFAATWLLRSRIVFRCSQ